MEHRTEQSDADGRDARSDLLDALADLVDYGTVAASNSGNITMPAQARRELDLPDGSQWRIFGSPNLGVALVVGPRSTPREALEFLLRAV